MLRACLQKAPGASIVTLIAFQSRAGAGFLFALQISNV